MGLILQAARGGSWQAAAWLLERRFPARWRRGEAQASERPTASFVSPLWLDDTGSAVLAALRAPAGTYNVADSDPLAGLRVRRREPPSSH